MAHRHSIVGLTELLGHRAALVLALQAVDDPDRIADAAWQHTAGNIGRDYAQRGHDVYSLAIAEAAREALAEAEPNTNEQWTALTEHLSAGHNLQVTTNGQPSLIELAAIHGAEHEHDVHDTGCCPDHGIDDHQPVQDRAEELARQRTVTAGVSQ